MIFMNGPPVKISGKSPSPVAHHQKDGQDD
jgi:hypothetical protein